MVAASATGTVRSTAKVVTALQPIQAGPPTGASIRKAADALGGLHRTLEGDLERVRAARSLLAGGARDRYLEAAAAASATATRAGQALELAAGLYGPPGTTRWFLALQNPAELRGTGGLIGEYGILESSPSGPRLTTVAPYQVLDHQPTRGAELPDQLAARYQRFAVDRAWSAVNIPPDMPTVGGIITQLYRHATGDRIDGVIAADPMVTAQVLKSGEPITADGVRLTAANVAQETLVKAYIRYAGDDQGRKRFLRQTAWRTVDAFRRALAERPVELMRGLAAAAQGRHLQLYSADAAAQKALVGLGLGGSAAAPAGSDYLMTVGVNAGGNKLDAFLRRSLSWRVRLAETGRPGPPPRSPCATASPRPGCPARSSARSTAASGSGSTSRSTPCTSPAATASPRPASTGGGWAPRPRRSWAGWPSPRPSASPPARRPSWATSWCGPTPPNGSVTTACATASCSVPRRPSCPTRRRWWSSRRTAGGSTPCRPTPGARGQRPAGRASWTGSDSWCSTSAGADGEA